MDISVCLVKQIIAVCVRVVNCVLTANQLMYVDDEMFLLKLMCASKLSSQNLTIDIFIVDIN